MELRAKSAAYSDVYIYIPLGERGRSAESGRVYLQRFFPPLCPSLPHLPSLPYPSCRAAVRKFLSCHNSTANTQRVWRLNRFNPFRSIFHTSISLSLLTPADSAGSNAGKRWGHREGKRRQDTGGRDAARGVSTGLWNKICLRSKLEFFSTSYSRALKPASRSFDSFLTAR